MKHLKENYLTKTYRGQIKPNSEVKKQLRFISKGCNEVYNHFLKKRIKTDKKNNRWSFYPKIVKLRSKKNYGKYI